MSVERKRVGVLMGGRSSEREVSLRTGRAVVSALEGRGHDVVPLELSPTAKVDEIVTAANVDVVFLALHGRYGEDGCVQGVLELLGVPYTGSDLMSSALAMDKVKSKELFRLHNVPTPPYYTFKRGGELGLDETHGAFGFPAIVKPRREGSSVGVCRVGCLSELEAAVDAALAYDDTVLVERFIEGKEISVGIIDGRVLGAIEIEPAGGLYDYAAKYESTETRYHVPARLSATRHLGVLNIAERAASALEVEGAVRVDLLVTSGSNEYVLEVNTIPGLTEKSLLPRVAEAAGFDFGALCETILAGARLKLGAQKNQTRESESGVERPAATAELRVAV